MRAFLDVKIDQSKFHSNSILARIESIFKSLINEGTRSYFGTQNVFGQAIVDSNDLLKDSLITTGEPYSPTLLV